MHNELSSRERSILGIKLHVHLNFSGKGLSYIIMVSISED